MIDLTGKIFGCYTVLYKDKTKPLRSRWICKCKCGRQKSIETGNLKKNPQKCKLCNTHILNRQFNDLIQKAKKRQIEVKITKEYLLNILEEQHYKCALTGIELIIDADSSLKTTASPDRIDPTKGYIPGNIQWVHKTINYMKIWLQQDEFIQWCRKVVEYNTIDW